MVRRVLVVLVVSLAFLFAGTVASTHDAGARSCPRGYYKRCGPRVCKRRYSHCKRRRRGRCIQRVYKRKCYRRCRCRRR
jgi:hypothetical protein